MIILIAGPTGAGKTDAGWALIDLAEPMVFLDCDWFAARTPFSWGCAADVESVYQALSLMVQYHIGRGIARFVIPITLEMASSFKSHRSYFDQFGLPMFPLQLRCTVDILRHRILQRDRLPTQKDVELAAIQEQQAAFEMLTGDFPVIDTFCLDERATAERIWSAVRNAGAA